MEIELDGVQDSDVANVLQAIKDVKHHAAAAPKKANKGMKRKSKQVDELQQAKEALSNDMNRLLVSPYVRNNVKPPALTLDTPAVPALRSLWTLLQGMRIRAEQTPVSKEEEARLEAAVQQAVIAIDPDHESLQEEDEKEKKDTVSMGPSRRSNRLAAQPKKNYDEKIADDELYDLVGGLVEDED